MVAFGARAMGASPIGTLRMRAGLAVRNILGYPDGDPSVGFVVSECLDAGVRRSRGKTVQNVVLERVRLVPSPKT